MRRRWAGWLRYSPWCWEEEGGQPELQRLRRRLEVTQLLGARPAASVVEGGVKARLLEPQCLEAQPE